MPRRSGTGSDETGRIRGAAEPPRAGPPPAAAAENLMCEIPTDPAAVVIFGASGDLTRRKLIPALFHLSVHACLAPRYAIVGFARTRSDDASFRDQARDATRRSPESRFDEPRWEEFVRCLSYIQGEYDAPESYAALARRLDRIDQELHLNGNRLFYLATPPETYETVIQNLGRAGLTRPRSPGSWVRIIVEKPFGRDLDSARRLNGSLLHVFDESQVYRIDHYLGKETVQNLLVFRFGNSLFEPLWNHKYISHVQITAAETLGVEHRAGFYDRAGAMRDMIQNHVLQLVSLVALEPPAAFEATSVRNEKLKVLQCIRPYSPEAVREHVVRGQYQAGSVDGKEVPGYRSEKGVRADSATETFVAARIAVDNWRWAGVPFYVRTGKRLARRVTEIAIRFHRAPHVVFRGRDIQPNWLVLNLQPEEGISLAFEAKLPGPNLRIQTVTMDFSYASAFGSATPGAYATLLNDCLRGDATLFDRADCVEAAWSLVTPILEAWAESRDPIPGYRAGSWGPGEAGHLLERDGTRWRLS
jgi:glucose-6-phosphate 1-dehydrogenase